MKDDFDPSETGRPPREVGYSEETKKICNYLRTGRGDQRIGQLLINAIRFSDKVDYEKPTDADSLEEVEAVKARNKARIEKALYGIEAPELLEALDNYFNEVKK